MKPKPKTNCGRCSKLTDRDKTIVANWSPRSTVPICLKCEDEMKNLGQEYVSEGRPAHCPRKDEEPRKPFTVSTTQSIHDKLVDRHGGFTAGFYWLLEKAGER